MKKALFMLGMIILFLFTFKQVASQPQKNVEIQDSTDLVYSTLFGGTANDHGLCIARDSQNDTIIAGLTYSSDFPTTEGAYDRTYNGGVDIFISKWSTTGTDILFSTFLGGSADDTFQGTNYLYHTLEIAIDNADNIVIYGTTHSSDFPVTTGAINSTFNGDQDIFVSKLSADGSTLLFSTFFGGTGRDSLVFAGNDRLILDDNDNIYITGYTDSTDFPITNNAYDNTSDVSFDIFVTKLSANGSEILYSTLLGGTENEYGTCLELDSGNNIIVGGMTGSSDFPITGNVWDSTLGVVDGFVAKLSIQEDSSDLEFSTLLGGFKWEYFLDINVDEDDNIYCTGITWSSDFPSTANIVQDTISAVTSSSTSWDPMDSFISKLSADGSTLLASTFLGGTRPEFTGAITLDTEGNPYIVGYTFSSDFDTTKNAYSESFGGISDFFITKLNPDLSHLNYSTFLGGSGADDHGKQESIYPHDAGDIELVDMNNVLVIGSTNSTDFPVTATALNSSLNGGSDVFVSQLNTTATTPPTITTSETTTLSTTTTTEIITTTSSEDKTPGFQLGVLVFLLYLGTIYSQRRKK